MSLLANGIAAGGSGLLLAVGIVAVIFPLIIIASAVLTVLSIKREAPEAAPAQATAEKVPAEKVQPPAEEKPEEKPEEKAEEAVEEKPEEKPEEAVPEEEAIAKAASDQEEKAAGVVSSGKETAAVRYDKSFTAKLIQSSDDVKRWYSQVKNALLSYKKTASRISWRADSINSGRVKLAKFAIRGKTLILYLALDPDAYADTKYKVERATGKRYAAVPCMLRLRGARRAKYALDLIAALAEQKGLTPVERKPVDYCVPYEDNEALEARGLIVRATKKKSSEAFFSQKAEKEKAASEGPSENVSEGASEIVSEGASEIVSESASEVAAADETTVESGENAPSAQPGEENPPAEREIAADEATVEPDGAKPSEGDSDGRNGKI